MNSKQKLRGRKRRHARVRSKLSGTSKVPRISVFRSVKHIYAQAVDDTKKTTLFSASDKSLKEKDKTKKSFKVGQLLGGLVKKEGFSKVLFDRGGFKYHGRVKALAEGLRDAGLKL